MAISNDVSNLYMGLTDYDVTYYGKDGLIMGRVEVCMGGHYGTICNTLWDNSEARVVCTQLGLSPYGKYHLTIKTPCGHLCLISLSIVTLECYICCNAYSVPTMHVDFNTVATIAHLPFCILSFH